MRRMLKQHAIVFVISDAFETDMERSLKLLSQRHDVIVASLEDPSESELPDIGLARFVDPETGANV
jgi:hypothetical protein